MNPKQDHIDTWLEWLDHDRPAAENMAIDELLFRQCRKTNSPLLRFYGWLNPAISLGYFQRYNHVLYPKQSGFRNIVRDPLGASTKSSKNCTACSITEEKTVIVRRCTGGGTVFHGNDITYALIVPSSHQLYNVSRAESYRIITEIIVSALAEFKILGEIADCNENTIVKSDSTRCFDSPVKNDILVNGRKVAGAAQKRNRFAFLQQGSIKTTNLDTNQFEDFKKILTNKFTDRFNGKSISFFPNNTLLGEAQNLVLKKYGNDDWNKKR